MCVCLSVCVDADVDVCVCLCALARAHVCACVRACVCLELLDARILLSSSLGTRFQLCSMMQDEVRGHKAIDGHGP